jgi:DNA-binding FadR family transcriptional regulator
MTATHAEIRDDLRRRITAGEFVAGDHLPDLQSLARRYGVEDSTGRRALHGLAAEGLLVLNMQAVVLGCGSTAHPPVDATDEAPKNPASGGGVVPDRR